MRFPFMSGAHRVRPQLYFNDALFLQVTVPGTCNFVCTRLLFQGDGRSQNTGVRKGARIAHQNPFPAFNTVAAVYHYTCLSLFPCIFPPPSTFCLFFFFPMCCFCPNWSLHMDARKLICTMRLSPKTGLRFTNKMLQSGRSFFLRSDHSRLWFGNEETFSSHDSRPYFPFYSVQTQATKTRSHPVLQWIALETMEVKWVRLII